MEFNTFPCLSKNSSIVFISLHSPTAIFHRYNQKIKKVDKIVEIDFIPNTSVICHLKSYNPCLPGLIRHPNPKGLSSL